MSCCKWLAEPGDVGLTQKVDMPCQTPCKLSSTTVLGFIVAVFYP